MPRIAQMTLEEALEQHTDVMKCLVGAYLRDDTDPQDLLKLLNEARGLMRTTQRIVYNKIKYLKENKHE